MVLTIVGEGFCGSIGDSRHMASSSCAAKRDWPAVMLGDVSCRVVSVMDERITCVVPPKSPAVVEVRVDVNGLGTAAGYFTFEFLIRCGLSSSPSVTVFGLVHLHLLPTLAH